MKIMLDAGHGPNTPGKRSPDGMREFDFNNAVANAMKAELEQYEGVTVLFAHDPSRDVPLKERTDKANAQKVDVYVSLHANANTGVMGDWKGIETYVYKTNPAEARKLANKVQSSLVTATGLFNRGVKTADFHVLRETNMTAILIEHGYMDSRIDLPKLKDAGFRTLCGVTNAKALAEVYGLKRKAVAVSASAPKPKEDDEVLERAIVIYGFADFAMAEVLAARIKAPVYTRASLPSGKIAKELFVVGGTTDGLQADKIIALTGESRFDVATEVKKYLGL